jgi:nitrate reductase assembly molybdenum cofactor insertion protein NarJ
MIATSGATAIDRALAEVLQDAAYWRLLGRLFECPSAAWRADVAALALEVTDADVVAAAGAALDEASEGLYHSVFGPGGPAPPREVSYHDTLELGSVMSSVTGYYHAFGYRPVLAESPDHVAVETGFLAFLRVKQAFALMGGDSDHGGLAATAAETFRTDHLAVFAQRLAGLLADAPASYLQAASRALAGRVGSRPGPKRLPVVQPVDEDDGGEFGCAS